MAATITLKKVLGRAQLNNGTDSEGNPKYVAISLGNMNETYFQTSEQEAATKLIAIVGALEACLSKTLASIEVVETSEVAAA